jgi:membrane dipeptidase
MKTHSLVIDAHADTLLKKYMEPYTRLTSTEEQSYHVTKDYLVEGNIDVQVFAIFIPSIMTKMATDITLEMINIAKIMAKKEDFLLIQSPKDLNNLSKTTTGMILSIEGAEVLERNSNLLPIFYELGIRNIGLCWSRPNLFGEGVDFSSKNKGNGLSKQGKRLVEEMESLGMVVDVAHLNSEGYSDVSDITTKPFIDSHSNAYEVTPVSRNLTDDQLEIIASAEGVVGMNFCPLFLANSIEEASIEDVITHICYISEKIGVKHVGIGSDFDGIAMTPKGLEDARKMSNIIPLLEKEGFSQRDISLIMGGNFQRVFEKVWT